MYYSPLRYPGGKSKLAPFMNMILNKLDLVGGTYIEPFAGGAGIAIELLLTDQVNHIVINDYDKSIASFWNAVVNDNAHFIDKLNKIDVTLEEWHRQKEILCSASNMSFDLGFATFFMNRTNRSGILNGGPIGGYEQDGNWKIDARFNKKDLANRIYAIGKRKRDISVYNKDANSFIKNYAPKYEERALIYFDPPYFEKGKELYMNFFSYNDHKRIEEAIKESVKCKWIVTYDDVKEITDIYDGYLIKKYDLSYSAASKRVASELMIFPDSTTCPTIEELQQNKICINFR